MFKVKSVLYMLVILTQCTATGIDLDDVPPAPQPPTFFQFRLALLNKNPLVLAGILNATVLTNKHLTYAQTLSDGVYYGMVRQTFLAQQTAGLYK